MAITSRLHQDGVAGLVKVTVDIPTDSGAIATLNLPLTLPSGAIVYGGMIDVDTALASAGAATVAVGLNTNTDLLAATGFATLTGRVAIVPGFSAASAVKLTANRTLKLTIAGAALTAGKFDIYLNYYEG